MLVAVLACVAGAETKKKTIRPMSKQQQQQLQATHVDATDFDRAMHAWENEDFSSAISYIKKHLRQNPNDAFGWTCLAGINSEADNETEAQKAIDKAVKCPVNESDPELLNWLYYTQSTVYMYLEDTEKTIEALNKAASYLPGDVDTYMRLGNLYKMQHEYDLAMVNYGLAVQYDRDNVEGYLGLGTVAGSLKKRDDAIKAYTMAIKLRPEFAECYALRAVEYYNAWEYDKAMDDIISALELENNNARALWVLDYVKDAAPDVAEKALKKKAKKSKDNSWLKLID